MLKRAERKVAPLKVGFSGSSGSGKTMSALLMASGMTDWNKIAVIDTENRSADLYSNLGGKDTYFTIPLSAPFSPESYIAAIKECEKAGMKVIIIDSITHEWDGSGGCLQIQADKGGRYQDWAAVTPRHQKFIDAIIQSPCHVFTTVRRKQDYDMTKDASGKLKVEKVGTKEVTRDGFEYELTLSFEIMQNHFAKQSKDRTGLFVGRPEFIITADTGKELLAWSQSGAAQPAAQPTQNAGAAEQKAQPAATPLTQSAPSTAAPAQSAAPASVGKEAVRAKLLEYSQKNKTDGMKKITGFIKELGATKLDDLPSDKYEMLLQKLA